MCDKKLKMKQITNVLIKNLVDTIIHCQVKYFLTFIFLITNCNLLKAQDYTWWNNVHHWDGITPWSRYIIMSPGYMGPNALPVPEIETGEIDNRTKLEFGAASHTITGDQTENLFVNFSYTLAKDFAALKFMYIPVEHYQMDTLIRDQRFARNYSGKGFATGDFYFGTVIGLFKNSQTLPPVSIGMYCKTALGKEIADARFTDSPGYYFTVASNKTFTFENSLLSKLQLNGMLGFYCWQFNYSDDNTGNLQDDAILYGIAADMTFGKYSLYAGFAGYSGWVNNRDKPMVIRTSFTCHQNNNDYKLGFQIGTFDVYYKTITLSVTHNWTRKFDEKKPE